MPASPAYFLPVLPRVPAYEAVNLVSKKMWKAVQFCLKKGMDYMCKAVLYVQDVSKENLLRSDSDQNAAY